MKYNPLKKLNHSVEEVEDMQEKYEAEKPHVQKVKKKKQPRNNEGVRRHRGLLPVEEA